MADLNTNIKTIIDAWGIKVVENAHKVLHDTIPPYGGGQDSALAGSVNFKVSASPYGYKFALLMNDYWINVEDGRGKNKTPPPTEPIEKFIRLRGLKIDPPRTLKGKRKTLSYDRKIKSLAYVIARSIGKKGIEARPFQSKLMTQELKDELSANLLSALKTEFIISIKE